VSNEDRPLPGGKLEYAVLVAVWDAGVVTVREAHERVGAPLGLVFTTTARVLDRLHAKGLIVRAKDGKAFRYRAAVARPEIDRARMSKTMSGFLTGGTRPAMAALVEAIAEIDAKLLDDLARAIESARRARREP
jgi:predicted transcriptional regulator